MLVCSRCGALHWVPPWHDTCHGLISAVQLGHNSECKGSLTDHADAETFDAVYAVGGHPAVRYTMGLTASVISLGSFIEGMYLAIPHKDQPDGC